MATAAAAGEEAQVPPPLEGRPERAGRACHKGKGLSESEDVGEEESSVLF